MCPDGIGRAGFERASVAGTLWATDDGSAGFKGNVVELMEHWTPSPPPDLVHAIGPIPMMRAVAGLTR